mmetsp:Transcript_10781/g.28655  ORF Transcript_10781/g.28655 Transcript_10781/m.28655 type:complete len:673 (+) Transcript_10781:2-2020(+)
MAQAASGCTRPARAPDRAMPTVVWHEGEEEPRVQQASQVDIHNKIFLHVLTQGVAGKHEQRKADAMDAVSERVVRVHFSPTQWCDITFEEDAKAQTLLGKFGPRRAGRPPPSSVASSAVGSSVGGPSRQGNKRPRVGAGGDDFGMLSMSNRLPVVGGYLHGASMDQRSAKAPTREERLQQEPATNQSAASAAQRTPEAGSAAKRAMGRSEEDEAPDAFQKYADKVVITSGTPEKGSYRKPPQREMHRSTPLFFIRPSLPQSSDVYRGYRSSETFGLRNLGNTCYLNAVMQALCSLREFVSDLRAMPQTVGPVAGGELFSCTTEILQQMSSPDSLRGPLSPAKLRERIAVACPMFANNEQQDAHEFFLEYLNQLHDELLSARNNWLFAQGVEPSMADNEIGALSTHVHLDSEVEKKLVCVTCRASRNIRERFRDFSLDFDAAPGNGVCMLSAMLEAYFASEMLEATCEHCAGASASMEKLLAAPPRTLVLHLKRFVPNLEKRRYDKQHQRVDFPARLDLRSCVKMADSGPSVASSGDCCSSGAGDQQMVAPRPVARPLVRRESSVEIVEPSGATPTAATFTSSPLGLPPPAALEERRRVAPPMWYSLRSVVAHDGASPHSGHYVNYSRGENGTWRLFDDSTVKQFGSEFELQRLGRQAYILFYVLETPVPAKV